jgi:DNA primase
MSRSDFKERVRREVPIDTYISRYIQLKKAGRNFLGLCPFHTEKTPSFNVNPVGGYYHCFGCKASGDLFRFVMDYHKVDFPRAMEILSEHSGIPLVSLKSPEDQEKQKRKEESFRINAKLSDYYQKNLFSPQGKEALEYLRNRGLTDEEIRQFDIGFALDGFQNLRPGILNTAWEEELAIELGILKKNEKGNIYDFFRNRIMFPIKDSSGRVTGFSGRTLSGDDREAKYVNSPNSLIYDKGRQIYNLYLAGEEIRASRQAILVEGVMDAIGLFSRGMKNVVAPLGTSFTENQSKILKNMADSVILVMDGDQAGKKGAARAAEILILDSIKTKVVELPSGLDPFDASRTWNRAELRQALDLGITGWEFLLNSILGNTQSQSDPDEKKTAIARVFEFLKKWDRETDRQILLSEAAQRLGLSREALSADFFRTQEQFGKPKADTIQRQTRSPVANHRLKKGVVECERSILAKLVVFPNLFRFANRIEELEFLDNLSVVLWEWLYTQFHSGEGINTAEFLSSESLPEEAREALAPFLMAEEQGNEESQDELFEELLLLQEKFYHRHEMDLLILDPSLCPDPLERVRRIAFHKGEEEKRQEYIRRKTVTKS